MSIVSESPPKGFPVQGFPALVDFSLPNLGFLSL